MEVVGLIWLFRFGWTKTYSYRVFHYAFKNENES